jgi:hypothetical protein
MKKISEMSADIKQRLEGMDRKELRTTCKLAGIQPIQIDRWLTGETKNLNLCTIIKLESVIG